MFATRAVVARNYRRLIHRRVSRERCLNLARFNAETTNLELLIRTTQVLQDSIGTPPRQVTRAVHPRSRLKPVPISHKALRT